MRPSSSVEGHRCCDTVIDVDRPDRPDILGDWRLPSRQTRGAIYACAKSSVLRSKVARVVFLSKLPFPKPLFKELYM